MNAYELADDLESYDWYYEHEVTGSDGFTQEIKTCNTEYVWDAASMLRQQADRIAELEKFNKAILKKGGYPYEKSNPIAWMSPDGKVSTTEGILFHIPLYTTPQTKPLSDEEIHELANEHLRTQNQDGHLVVLRLEDFARAIEERHGIK